MTRIFLVEDETELARIVRAYLERAGYEVSHVTDGQVALSRILNENPDLVVLDLNLPGMDGMEIAREIRKVNEIPIIMATARVDEADRLDGLESGADDYLIKPYSPRELVARVKAVLRRSGGGQDKPRVLVDHDLVLDIDQHQVSLAGKTVDLTPSEFSLLEVFLSQPGRVFSRMQLLEAALGTAYEGYERTVDAHIKNLRQKIEQDPRNPQRIETVFGVGYRYRRI